MDKKQAIGVGLIISLVIIGAVLLSIFGTVWFSIVGSVVDATPKFDDDYTRCEINFSEGDRAVAYENTYTVRWEWQSGNTYIYHIPQDENGEFLKPLPCEIIAKAGGDPYGSSWDWGYWCYYNPGSVCELLGFNEAESSAKVFADGQAMTVTSVDFNNEGGIKSVTATTEETEDRSIKVDAHLVFGKSEPVEVEVKESGNFTVDIPTEGTGTEEDVSSFNTLKTARGRDILIASLFVGGFVFIVILVGIVLWRGRKN